MVVTPVPESPEPSLVVVKWARSVIGPQLVGETGTAVMWTLMLAPAATSWAAQSRVQAEVGIRDFLVAGVQTCALPIRPLGARLSVMCTPWARPAPVLWAVMV